jgi:fumarylacetoacetate (FAA) hydrolase family protein
MAHQFILEGMLTRLMEERLRIDPDHIEELIRHDLAIRRVERDLRTVEARLSRMG